MNRLQAEQRRLYLVPNTADGVDALIDAQGQVRAMVVDVAQPAGWAAVAALCQGIQDELDLPTPAIAVSGGTGFQVWLSLAEPVSVLQAQTFLAALCQRFLGTVPARHVQRMPVAEPSATPPARHASLVPALQGATGRWSAFVAPGLASMFADEPWLDVRPGIDAQAQLLSRLESISVADFARTKQELGLSDTPAAPLPVATTGGNSGAATAPTNTEIDPRRFLLSVMNDPAVEMRLRIEAAKALLP
ncbi:hypothetical protein [Rhodoferax sp. PAMC 29310]|uniref:hypothetical protein n=1 Tax=Rhodoferax sp. PAMC 29310 TaxID=2822760 RepID=UPI001B3351A7|nr:hypothetical protein [Rhodoferax sp. PAMC 29310]